MSSGETLSALLSGDTRARDVALLSPEDGRRTTFAELEQAVLRLAGLLRSTGIERNDRVGLVLPNGPELIQMLLAVTMLGAAAAPLNPAYTVDEYAFYLDDLQPRLLVVPAGDMQAARAAAGTATILDLVAADQQRLVLLADGHPIEREQPFDAGGADDLALLLHISGTTSRPKQVPLLQRNLMASARTIASFYELGSEDVSYCAMPL